MMVETRTATGQANSEKLKSQTSGQFIQDPGALNQGDCAGPEGHMARWASYFRRSLNASVREPLQFTTAKA